MKAHSSSGSSYIPNKRHSVSLSSSGATRSTSSSSSRARSSATHFLPDWALIDLTESSAIASTMPSSSSNKREGSSGGKSSSSSSRRHHYQPQPSYRSGPKMECVCGSKECSGVSAVFKVLQDKRGCFVEVPPTEMERTLMLLDGDLGFATTGPAAQTAWQLRGAYLRHLQVREDELEEENASHFVALHHFHPQVVQDSHACENDDRLAIVCRTIHESSWKALYLNLKDKDRIPGTEGSYFVVPNYPFLKAKEDAQRAFQKFRLRQHGGAGGGSLDDDSLTSRNSLAATSSLTSMPVAFASPYHSGTSQTSSVSLSTLKANERRRESSHRSSREEKVTAAAASSRRKASSTRAASVPPTSLVAAPTVEGSSPRRRGVPMPWSRLVYQPKDASVDRPVAEIETRRPSQRSASHQPQPRRGRDPRPATHSLAVVPDPQFGGGGGPLRSLRRSLSRGRSQSRRRTRSESVDGARGGGFFRRRGRSGSATRTAQAPSAAAARVSPPKRATSSPRSRSMVPESATAVRRHSVAPENSASATRSSRARPADSFSTAGLRSSSDLIPRSANPPRRSPSSPPGLRGSVVLPSHQAPSSRTAYAGPIDLDEPVCEKGPVATSAPPPSTLPHKASAKSSWSPPKIKRSAIVRQSSDGSMEVDLDALMEEDSVTSSRSGNRDAAGSVRVDLDEGFPAAAAKMDAKEASPEVPATATAVAPIAEVNPPEDVALDVVFTEAALAEAQYAEKARARLAAAREDLEDGGDDALYDSDGGYVSGGDVSGFEPEPTAVTHGDEEETSDWDFGGSSAAPRKLAPPDLPAVSSGSESEEEESPVRTVLKDTDGVEAYGDDDAESVEPEPTTPSSMVEAESKVDTETEEAAQASVPETVATSSEESDCVEAYGDDEDDSVAPEPTASSSLAETEQEAAAVTAVATVFTLEDEPARDNVACGKATEESLGKTSKKLADAVSPSDDCSERSGHTAAATESVSSVQESLVKDSLHSARSNHPDEDNDESENADMEEDVERYVCNPFDDDMDESLHPMENGFLVEHAADTPLRSTNPFDHEGLSPPVSSNPFDDEKVDRSLMTSQRTAQTPSPSKKYKLAFSSPHSDLDLTETTADSTDWDSSVPSPGNGGDEFWGMDEEEFASSTVPANVESTLPSSRMNLLRLSSLSFLDKSGHSLEGEIQEYRLPEELKPLKELSEQPVDRSESIAVFAKIEAKRSSWAQNELRGFKEQWGCYKDLIPVMARECDWVEDLLKTAFKSMEGYTDMIRAVATDSLLDETDRIITDQRKRTKLASKRSKEASKFPTDSSVLQPVLDMLLRSVEQLEESAPSLSPEVDSIAELSAHVSARGSDLAKAGDRIMLDMEYMETKIKAAWAHLENVDRDLEGNEDHWLAEASYRNTVREGSALFKAHYTELMKICDGIISIDEERRSRTKEILLSVLPRRRRLFLRVLETAQPSLSVLEGGRLGREEVGAEVDRALEYLARQGLAKQKKSRSSILNRSLSNKLDLKVELDLTPLEKNNLFDSTHVKEIRAVEAKSGSKSDWQLSLAILTHDSFLHIVYCDLPESELQEFLASQSRAEVFLATKCEGRMPEITLPLSECQSSMSADREHIQITSDGSSPLQKMLKRKVFVRLSTPLETSRWFEAHEAFWSRQGEETPSVPQVSRV